MFSQMTTMPHNAVHYFNNMALQCSSCWLQTYYLLTQPPTAGITGVHRHAWQYSASTKYRIN